MGTFFIFLLERLFREITRPCDKLKAGFRYAGPRPQDAGTPSLLQMQFLSNYTYSAIAVLATCPRTQGYRKEPTFPHYNRRSWIEPRPPAWQAAAITAQPLSTTWGIFIYISRNFKMIFHFSASKRGAKSRCCKTRRLIFITKLHRRLGAV
jgi:hypothetical protein